MEQRTPEEPEESGPLYTSILRVLLKLIIASGLEVENEHVKLRDADERASVLKLCSLGKHYFGEMLKCNAAESYLAATIMAASGLETLLVLACLCYRDLVTPSKTWQRNRKVKKNRSFFEKLGHTELGTLISVGEELHWFSAEIPREFSDHVGPNDLAALLANIPPNQNPSVVAASLAKGSRNTLHPGYCLRMDITLEDQQSLLNGIGFMGLALASFIKQHDFASVAVDESGTSKD